MNIKADNQIKRLAKQCKVSLKSKGIQPVWYFKSPAVRYGIAVVNGAIWSFTICAAKRELRGWQGAPVHFSPTPKLAKGLARAKASLGI